MKPFRFTSYDSALERSCVVVAVVYGSVLVHVGAILIGLFFMPFLLSLLDLMRPQVTFAMPEQRPVEMAIIELPPPIPEPPVVEEVKPAEPVEADTGTTAVTRYGRGAEKARKEAVAMARSAGLLGLLSTASQQEGAFASVFGTSGLGGDVAVGEPSGLYGILEGGVAGGLGVGGLGYGGGGTGEGTIGLGSIGTGRGTDSGYGTGSGDGTGSGWGRLGGASGVTSKITVVSRVRVLEGELDRGVARRSLQRRRGLLSLCHPDDEVTVTVRLLVGADGVPTRVDVIEGGDQSVRECVARALEPARFPTGNGARSVEADIGFRR